MKKTYAILLLVTSIAMFSMSSCADAKKFEIINKDESGKQSITVINAEPYGLFDKDEYQMDTVYYRVSKGNVVLSIIFSETIIVPVWLIGFDLYYPDRLKTKEEFNRIK